MTWETPMLFEDDFQLSQHFAAGCTNKTWIEVVPGGSIPFTMGCASSYPGNGHWHYNGQIRDLNGDGKISEYEWQTAMNYAADNGNTTGHGHYKNHRSTVTVNGGEEIYEFVDLFTS